MKENRTLSDNIIDGIFFAIATVIVFLSLYPLYFIVIASLSDPMKVITGNVWFLIRGFYTKGYELVFADSRIWTGYRNTLVYTSLGAIVSLLMTIPAGYALSRRDLYGRKVIMLIFIFTMYFSGGLIPTYLRIKDYGMINTLWVMIIPLSVNVYNLIITRTFFQNTVPPELLEAARIDGCGNTRFFIQIVLPLSKAIISVITLYVIAMRWNSYFHALLYLTSASKHTLQLILREIFFANATMDAVNDSNMFNVVGVTESMKYASIVVSTIPIMCFYPFIQKYFTQGVMIGSVKG